MQNSESFTNQSEDIVFYEADETFMKDLNKSRDFIIKHIPSRKKVEDEFTTGTTENKDCNNIFAKPLDNNSDHSVTRTSRKPATVSKDTKQNLNNVVRRVSLDNLSAIHIKLTSSINVLARMNSNFNSIQGNIKESSTFPKTEEVALEYFNTFKASNSNPVEEEESQCKLQENSSVMTDFSIRLERIRNASNRTNLEMIDNNFLLRKLRPVDVKGYQVTPQNKNLHHLYELQNFSIDTNQIWVIKLSMDGTHLATGGKSGILKIFEVIQCTSDTYQEETKQEDIMSLLKLFCEIPKRVYKDHTNDIIDISWSPKDYNMLLTASLDHFVILWNIQSDGPLRKYDHFCIVTCVSFCPILDSEGNEKFVSGSLDKFVRIWNITKNERPEYFNIKEYITAISFSPSGDSIYIGTHNGKCIVYDYIPKLRYNFFFNCRNRMGRYSFGKKITNIQFVNKAQALITTNDSRVRLVNVTDGKTVHKYKGHKNEEFMVRAFCDEMKDMIITASEDGYCYVWNKTNKETRKVKNYHYEFFKPFPRDIVSTSIVAGERCLLSYLNKLFIFSSSIEEGCKFF